MIPKLSAEQIRSFQDDGYLIFKDPLVRALKTALKKGLKEMSLEIIRRHPTASGRLKHLRSKKFSGLFDWCIANEKDNAITRVFYELFPVAPVTLSLTSDPFFIETSRRLGLAYPVLSTLPILRIDRPSEMRYIEPSHQDYWYSMLSANSVTYWFPVLPIEEDMGHLLILPGSHRDGLRPIRQWMDDGKRFVLRDEIPDAEYTPVRLKDDEMLVFSQFLVHKSGTNRGSRARLTLQVRHNDLATLTDLASSFTPKHSIYTAQAQQDWLKRSADAPVPDQRPLKRSSWNVKTCDVCASGKTESLGLREFVWPTRTARYLMRLEDVRCARCGFVFEGKAPNADFLNAYYADAFSLESRTVEIEPSYDAGKRLALIRRFIPAGGRILEVGANRGDFCRYLEAHGYRATGVDPLDGGDRALVSKGFVTPGRKLNGGAGVFDAVVSYYVLEHVTDARAWLTSVLKSLKPGGVMIVEVPDFERHPAASLNHEHFLHFTPYHLARLLELLGCEVLAVDTRAPSRFFGFAVAAQKRARSKTGTASGNRRAAVKSAAPDTIRIYKHALRDKRSQEERERSVVDRVAAIIKDAPFRPGVQVCFWGANEIATSIAAKWAAAAGPAPWIVDNSSQKAGLPHEGFAGPIRTPDLTELRRFNCVFVLCSPSWNVPIRKQIEGMGLTHFSIVDIQKYGIGGGTV